MKTKLSNSTVTRRTFLKTSAAVSASTLLGAEKLFAAGTEKIPLALIGCGGRGRDAVLDCLAADPATELTAMADLFEDRLKDTLDKLKEKHPERIRVTPQTMFVGFDAYQKALAVPGILLMINAAPPHF
ncbi:MAG TPA: twin-arginine translocation signal domain-containing protein, partial [Anaerohalosphaeraceae bacterium]|nr:twin-arginine translocation signal domain-containing protein [Anaerohalosphaeraceae bacterium]